MERLQVEWSGEGVTGPGLSTFFGDEAGGTNLVSNVVTFINAVKGFFPAGITWIVPNGGDLINPGDGALAGTWSGSGGASIASSGSGSHAQGVGTRVVWRTSAIRGGRRVRGSTFLVPLTVGQYDNQGSILDTTRTTMNNAATALIVGLDGKLVIWSRPRPGLAGAMVPVDSALVPDKVSWLRSRRT